MKSLLLLPVLLAAGFFGYPLLAEDASAECDALERMAIREVMPPNKRPQAQDRLLGEFIQGLSKGRFASVAVRNEYPNLPASAGCATLYWRAIANPQGFREIAARLLR